MSKSGFEHEITELRLGLPGDRVSTTHRSNKSNNNNPNSSSCDEKKREYYSDNGGGHTTATTKAAVAVGWPPVCSYRKRSIGSEKECIEASTNNKKLVKISMDGVPFLRKIDLTCYQDYSDLFSAIQLLFGSSPIIIKEALKEADKSEYVPIYEDKDGDWLLVGDVPWKMFMESCTRLRIMKRADANYKGFGLQSKKLHNG